MTQLPKFLLCENEEADLEGEYVLHTHKPRFIAKRIYDDPLQNFTIVDDIDNMNSHFNNDQQQVMLMMKSLERWFDVYQDYLDEQYGGDED